MEIEGYKTGTSALEEEKEEGGGTLNQLEGLRQMQAAYVAVWAAICLPGEELEQLGNQDYTGRGGVRLRADLI